MPQLSAKLHLDINVSPPATINVELARADYLTTSNIFRTTFEVFLALLSGTLGAVTQVGQVTLFAWLLVALSALGATVFLVLAWKWRNRAAL